MATPKNKILRVIIHELLDECNQDDLEYIQGIIDVKLSTQVIRREKEKHLTKSEENNQ